MGFGTVESVFTLCTPSFFNKTEVSRFCSSTLYFVLFTSGDRSIKQKIYRTYNIND